MKAYTALFRIRFINSLQYRVAALAGLSTQFAWGFMEILAFLAFYRSQPDTFPVEFPQLVSYIWLQQAFLSMLAPWSGSREAIESIVNGNIAYELARPMNIYDRWFCEAAAVRISRAVLRCVPILVVAFILPAPFRMILPPSFTQFLLFLISLVLGLCTVIAFCMLDNISTFYTMSQYNNLFLIAADFFAGGILPIPFFPGTFRRIVELSPFAAMENAPLRIYSGNLSGSDAVREILLQLFWFAILLLTGKLLMRRSLRRVIAQGG